MKPTSPNKTAPKNLDVKKSASPAMAKAVTTPVKTTLVKKVESKWLAEPTVKVKVGKSYAGMGLFADQDIQPGQRIIEYTGERIPTEEANRRGGKYLFEINSKITIDGKDRKNLARYINHECKPNCEANLEKGRVFIYAWKKIKKGDELTYDYGKEYFDEIIKPHGCLCPGCRAKNVAKEAK